MSFRITQSIGGGGGGGLTSVGLSMPGAFSVANSPLIANGTINVTGAGSPSQYIDGTGALKTFPTNIGGGSAVVYYLNGNVSQGTIGGNPYYQMSKIVNLGPNADFSINANGYVAQFITDPSDPQLPFIPGGAWQFQLYFSASSGGGNPRFYIEIYKYNGTTFTLIADNSTIPESITGGTSIDLYTTLVAMPQTSLALTDRIAVRVYVIHSSRTITLHTEGPHIDKVTTTFTYGLVSLNGLTDSVQYLNTGTSGTDFNITQSGADTHVFNLPTASAVNTGKLSSADWTTFNNKYNLPPLTSGSVLFSNGINISQDNLNFFWDNTNKRLGIGTNNPLAKLHLTNGLLGGTTLLVQSTGLNDGIVIDSGEYPFLSFRVLGVQNFGIQGLGGTEIYFRPSKNLEWRAVDTNTSVFGSVNMDVSANSYSYYLHNLILGGSTSPSEKLQLASGNFLIANGSNIILGTTSGTKIGTAINQKLGFFGKTPITQPLVATKTLQGLADEIKNLGLIDFTGNFETTITLTQIGSSGPASWTPATNTLNIPDYSTAFSGFVPTSRTINTTGPLQGGGNLSADLTLSITQASGVQNGFLSSADWTTFNNKVGTGAINTSGLTMNTNRLLGRTTAGSGAIEEIQVTFTGTTGSATFSGGILNIPNYSGAGYITSVWNVTTQTGANYNATNNDYVIINATTFTLNLPNITTAGVRIGVKLVGIPAGSFAIQVLSNSAPQTIDGQTSNVANASTNLYIFNQWDAYTLVSYNDGGVFKWAIES
jgi:hypothetical protein